MHWGSKTKADEDGDQADQESIQYHACYLQQIEVG
jgi:hypothetical protein